MKYIQFLAAMAATLVLMGLMVLVWFAVPYVMAGGR